MKFNRSSKSMEPGAAPSSYEFSSIFKSNPKNIEPAEKATSESKAGRFFSRGRNGGKEIDMLKSIDDEGELQNDKSSRTKLFRRKSKDEIAASKESSAAAHTNNNPSVFLFPSKSAEDEGREAKSSRSLFRTRSKDNEDATGNSEKKRDAPEPAAITESAATSKSSTKLFSKSERRQIKAVIHTFSPDAEIIKVEKDDTPPTLEASNHVLIKVQASTVTLNDCLLRRGFDFDVLTPVCLPLTPGYDVVGNIVELGSDVTNFAVGDHVAAIVRCGGNARWLSVPASSLVKVSSNLDTAEVAALVSIYTTAYQAMRKISTGGQMFALQDKKVLILGGMDGVGQALIQLCKKARATIYVSAPKVRHIYLKSVLGVSPLLEGEWLSSVEGQMDYVFDGVCENGTEKSIKALNAGGQLVCYGHSSMLNEREMGILGAPLSARFNQLYNIMSSRVHTVDIWDSFISDPTTYKQDLKTLCQLLKWNKLKPHIAKRVALPEVAGAQTKLEQGDIRGTIVCFPWRPIIRSGKISAENEE